MDERQDSEFRHSDPFKEMKAQGVARTLGALIQTLAPFSPQTIYDGFGLVLTVLGRRTGRDFNVGAPWQLFDGGTLANDKKVVVNLHSHLLRSLRFTDHIQVVGLDYPFDVRNGDKIWLEVKIKNYAVDAVNVKHGTPSTEGWVDYPEPVKFQGEDAARQQTRAFVPIGYVITTNDLSEYDPPGVRIGSGSESLTAVNLLRTHLLMGETAYNGETILYPLPWFGALINRV